MSVMFNVVFASRCRSTHHKLAMDALRHVRGDDSVLWRNLFLKYHGSYLEGAKAPDDVFKDFKNHVLHVGDGWWGGAIKAVQTWYDRTVHALKQRDWEEAVYSAGVLSHYYTDPCQPFHTGQSEAEGAVHRAAEWSICKCYHEFQNILEADLGGYPEMELPATAEWLADHVKAGAAAANVHYEACIDHYDLARGVKNPLVGMDQEMKDRVARMVGHATVGFARLLERVFDESYIQPPHVELTLDSLIAQLRQPVNWVVKQLKDVKDRHAVMEMWREFQASGKVVEELPEDDRAVRRLHAQEVRGIALGELDAEPARAPGAAYGEGAPKRHRSSEPVTARARGNRPRYTRSGRNVVARTTGGGQVPVESPVAGVGPGNGYAPPTAPARPVTTASVLNEGRQPHAWNTPRVTALPERETLGTPTAARSLQVEARIAPLVSREHVEFAEPSSRGDDYPLASRESSRQQPVRSEPVPAAPVRPELSVSRQEYASAALDRTFQDRRLEEAAASARLEQARQERERAELERTARENAERERAERANRERLERERLERERLEHERLDAAREHAARVEAQRVEAQRLESQRRSRAAVEPFPTDNRIHQDGGARFDRQNVDRHNLDRPDTVPMSRDTLPTRLVDTDPPREETERSRDGRPETPRDRETTTTRSSTRARKFYLEISNPVADGPSIGNKTAERLRTVGIRSVSDLLNASPEKTAARISQRWITADVIRQWQDQARLVCTIPDLRGHDAQVLVGCGILSADALARQSPQQLLATVEAFCATSAGERALRGGTQPDLAEVTDWIDAAMSARELKVA